MDKITYKQLTSESIAVYLASRRVGTIERVIGGWQYFPKGRLTGGEVFESVREVKDSLEGEE